MKTRWWMASASVIGILMVVLGVGSLVDPDNTVHSSGSWPCLR